MAEALVNILRVENRTILRGTGDWLQRSHGETGGGGSKTPCLPENEISFDNHLGEEVGTLAISCPIASSMSESVDFFPSGK